MSIFTHFGINLAILTSSHKFQDIESMQFTFKAKPNISFPFFIQERCLDAVIKKEKLCIIAQATFQSHSKIFMYVRFTSICLSKV